jgi:hypothetical protein
MIETEKMIYNSCRLSSETNGTSGCAKGIPNTFPYMSNCRARKGR